MIDLEGLPGLLYSRKSRKDIEAEKEAAAQGRPYDTLKKHREELLRMSRQHKVHVVDLLEELVSGEFIAERPKMQKVLNMLASGEIKWVGVMDEDRLGRGDKIDQGRIERAFKESGAYILTPHKIVDMQDEADELYMDYKGMGARYEYKQTKKRLLGGRKRSAERGNYVGKKPPYGYLRGIDLKTEYPQFIHNYATKATDIENLKLYPHPIESEFARNIFSWFLDGKKISDILIMLNALTPSPSGKTDWRYHTVHRILKNPVYCGTIQFGKRGFTKLESGKYREQQNPVSKIAIAENAHEALISKEGFEQVQKIIKGNYNPPINRKKKLVNPAATLLKCEYCGMAMSYRIYYSEKTKGGRGPLILCRNVLCDKNHAISFKHVEAEILRRIEEYYINLISDPAHSDIDKPNSDSIQLYLNQKKSILSKIEESKKQLDNAHDLLENKIYDIPTFLERQKKISEKISQYESELLNLTDLIDREYQLQNKAYDIAPIARNIIEAYSVSSVEEQNELLKSLIEVIYYSKPQKGGSRTKPIFNLTIVWRDIL